jgi:hypothetical protein
MLFRSGPVSGEWKIDLVGVEIGVPQRVELVGIYEVALSSSERYMRVAKVYGLETRLHLTDGKPKRCRDRYASCAWCVYFDFQGNDSN